MYWILYWKWKTDWLCGSRVIVSLVIAWLMGGVAAVRPASRRSILPPITSLGKDQNLKFEVQFLLNEYSFHIIVKFQLCKWETVVFILLVPEPQNRGDSTSVVLNSLRLVILKGMWHDLSYWQHFDLSSASHLPPSSFLHSCWTPALCPGTWP